MVRNTLLGFPTHTFPYRHSEFTTLSTVSFVIKVLTNWPEWV